MINSFRIVLADDYAPSRQNLEGILNGQPGLKVVGEARDGLELLSLLNLGKLNPHMIILDISMPNLNGIEATRKIKKIYPDVKILILTIHKNREYLGQALSAGAEGYLLKEDMDLELFPAIEKVRQGGIFVSPSLTEDRV